MYYYLEFIVCGISIEMWVIEQFFRFKWPSSCGALRIKFYTSLWCISLHLLVICCGGISINNNPALYILLQSYLSKV